MDKKYTDNDTTITDNNQDYWEKWGVFANSRARGRKLNNKGRAKCEGQKFLLKKKRKINEIILIGNYEKVCTFQNNLMAKKW